MQTISGFVPTGQVINLSARAGALLCPPTRRRFRPVGRSLTGFVLLLLGFLLILFGSTLSAPQPPAHKHLPYSRSEEAIATVASLVGRSAVEEVSLLEQARQLVLD